ncbi:response regulator transcription factor [Candidatus Aminicenantes bacterium AC-708-M15]|jgi:DNA-binding response OmpR family regulator|nr:response regulator transcription factor [SCandidatus Aminicenantes bacterium Aminicenantia_JdfR_composite]MCP2596941.1 response regulator transcription factor [Candidatus Aminicenantes bacterium AC-335-G13]MCP2603981.1 response regulator transcription factor [Candidatus Aminicenantes bacterium AC-708-M15]
MTKILIIEDDKELLNGLIDNLTIEGYSVISAEDGENGLELARKESPDLIILDLMLPKLSGQEICRILREEKNLTPIIMLTAKGSEYDKVKGLKLGADDYITKPFSLLELLARIEAILRRIKGERAEPEVYKIGDITVDFVRLEAKRGNKEIKLSPKEFSILKFLIKHQGEVVRREALLREIWGYNVFPSTRTIDNFIVKLRKKIEKNPDKPRHILTVHGVGYKFIP